MKILGWFSLAVLIGPGILLPEYIGTIQKGYSSEVNYLSELGALDAPYANIINYGSFLPIAIAIMVLVALFFIKLPHSRRAKIGTICLLSIAVGYLGAFFFRCDAGCPIEGSPRQALHNLGGLIEYTGAITGLWLIYFGLQKKVPLFFTRATLITVLIVMLGFVMMASSLMPEAKGAWQRLAEYTLVVWFIIATLWQPKQGMR